MIKNIVIILVLFNLTFIEAQNNNADKKTSRKKVMNDDKKELDNIAVRTFSWLTGTSTDNDYVSVGKIAHYFGVISLRLDSDHSLSRGGIGKKTFQILNSQQQNDMLSLLEELKAPLKEYHDYNNLVNRTLETKLRRAPFNEALCIQYSEKKLISEAKIGIISAKKFKTIYESLDASQIKEFKKMRQAVEAKSPMEDNLSKTQKDNIKNVSHENTLELWNINTRFMSWITGEQSDNEFTPTGKMSQHFGFVKVRVGSGHSITRGGVGKKVLELLNDAQIKKMKNYLSYQKPVMTDFLAKRFELTLELRNMLENNSIDKKKIIEISSEMGRLEGEMTVKQAQLYVNLRDTFTNDQIAQLFEMRFTYLPSKGEDPKSNQDLLERGIKVFNLCAMCHSLEKDKNLVGPSLYKIIHKPSGQQSGYNYSPSMISKKIKWSIDNLDKFLENPRNFVPSTTMPFSGIENAIDRKALLLYLDSLD